MEVCSYRGWANGFVNASSFKLDFSQQKVLLVTDDIEHTGPIRSHSTRISVETNSAACVFLENHGLDV